MNFREFLKYLGTCSLEFGIFVQFGVLIFGWLSLILPFWVDTNPRKPAVKSGYDFGLWEYCTDSITLFSSGEKCSQWTNDNIPDFIDLLRGLITTGIVILTLTFMFNCFCMILNKKRLIIVSFLWFVLGSIILCFGLIVYESHFEDYFLIEYDSKKIRRGWSYWMFILTLIFCIIAIFFFYSHIMISYSLRMNQIEAFKRFQIVLIPLNKLKIFSKEKLVIISNKFLKFNKTSIEKSLDEDKNSIARNASLTLTTIKNKIEDNQQVI